MSSFDRRIVLFGLASAGLTGCGFAPAYGPGGNAARLQGRIGFNTPATTGGYLILRRLEERLGRGDNGPFIMRIDLDTTESGVGITAGDEATRAQLFGTARWQLVRVADGEHVLKGEVSQFTGYSTTGSTVATQAAERDALERLCTILADLIVDEMILSADKLVQ